MELLTTKFNYEMHPETLEEVKKFSNEHISMEVKSQKVRNSNYYNVEVIFWGSCVGKTCASSDFRQSIKEFDALIPELDKKHCIIKR